MRVAWRRRSAPEIKLRLMQAATAFFERRGFVSSIEAVESYTAPHLSFPSLDRSDVRNLRNRWPRATDDLISRAERIRSGKFDLLGYRNLQFGCPVDWHLDPVACTRAPSTHWSRIRYLDSSKVGDHKVVWELNRHHHFVNLGQAYCLTREERFAQTFVEQIEGWMTSNPPKQGINWASNLEVALRSISWIWALHFFEPSNTLPTSFKKRLLQLLSLNGHHIETYLSTYFSPNTHLTGEALGLLYLGTAFPSLSSAKRWRELSWTILMRELERQVHPDGVYFERSSWYQAYTVDSYLHAMVLADFAGQTLPSQARSRIEAASDVLLYLTRSDGTVPLLGDDDGGRLLPLEVKPGADFTDTLALSAVLFERPDYCGIVGDAPPTLAWLFGEEGVRRYEGLGRCEPSPLSKVFLDGGWCVMRDGWNASASHMVINGGPRGAQRGAHAHADNLSFELSIAGSPILIDPGTYTYVGPERNEFRGTAAHNTVTVNGKDSSAPRGLFQWERFAESNIVNWISTSRFDYFEGWHDGFSSRSEAVLHWRSVLWIKDRYWLILDRITGEGSKRVTVNFHPAPDVELHRETKATMKLRHKDGVELALSCGGSGVFGLEKRWASRCYGRREPAPSLSFEQIASGCVSVLTALTPVVTTVPVRSVAEQPAEGGRCWTLPREGDCLVVTDNGPARVGSLVIGVPVCWIRRQPSDGRALEFVAIGPGRVNIDGTDISIDGDWAVGEWRNGTWSLKGA